MGGQGATVAAFAPTDISGLTLWADGSDTATLFSDTGRTTPAVADGAVKGVTDKSGSGNHLSEATNGPTRKDAIQNSLTVLRFDGSNDVLRCTGLSQAQPTTWFIVVKDVGAVAANTTFFDGATARQVLFTNAGSPKHWALFAGSVLTGGVSGSAFHTISAVFNGASSGSWVDGAADVATANAGAAAITSLRICLDNGGTIFTQADIGELLLYNSSLSAGNRQTVEAYLKAKWATP